MNKLVKRPVNAASRNALDRTRFVPEKMPAAIAKVTANISMSAMTNWISGNSYMLNARIPDSTGTLRPSNRLDNSLLAILALPRPALVSLHRPRTHRTDCCAIRLQRGGFRRARDANQVVPLRQRARLQSKRLAQQPLDAITLHGRAEFLSD